MNHELHVGNFVKHSRSKLRMTQEDLAERSGVGLRFIRELEGGKETLRIDKVNQVLQLFGYTLSVKPARLLDPYLILLRHMNRPVRLQLKNKTVLEVVLMEEAQQAGDIIGWKWVPLPEAARYRKTGDRSLLQTIAHADIDQIETIGS